MDDTVSGLQQEREIGDAVFNTDTSNIYKTNKSINNDRFKGKPDIETYLFSNDNDTKMYCKTNGVVTPIRIHNKLFINNVPTKGVYIVKYYRIYRDTFDSIDDILRYYNIYSEDLTDTINNKIKEILVDGNQPLSNSISIRLITFIPLEVILIKGNYSIQDMVIGNDLSNMTVKKNIMDKFMNNKSKLNKTSLTIDIIYKSNNQEQLYYNINGKPTKIKTIPNEHSNQNVLTIMGTAGSYSGLLEFDIVDESNRHVCNLYKESELNDIPVLKNEQTKELMKEYLEISRKELSLIDSIKSYLINNEQERLNIKMAIMKMTEQVNKNQNVDKENLNSLTNIVKLFKAIL